ATRIRAWMSIRGPLPRRPRKLKRAWVSWLDRGNMARKPGDGRLAAPVGRTKRPIEFLAVEDSGHPRVKSRHPHRNPAPHGDRVLPYPRRGCYLLVTAFSRSSISLIARSAETGLSPPDD